MGHLFPGANDCHLYVFSQFHGARLMTKKAVDKDLKRIIQLERATLQVSRRNINLGLGLLFLVAHLV